MNYPNINQTFQVRELFQFTPELDLCSLISIPQSYGGSNNGDFQWNNSWIQPWRTQVVQEIHQASVILHVVFRDWPHL